MGLSRQALCTGGEQGGVAAVQAIGDQQQHASMLKHASCPVAAKGLKTGAEPRAAAPARQACTGLAQRPVRVGFTQGRGDPMKLGAEGKHLNALPRAMHQAMTPVHQYAAVALH